MAASEKGDLEMRHISGKLNEHFAFLNANGAMIAYIVYTLGLYVSVGFNRLIVINFWQLID